MKLCKRFFLAVHCAVVRLNKARKNGTESKLAKFTKEDSKSVDGVCVSQNALNLLQRRIHYKELRRRRLASNIDSDGSPTGEDPLGF